MTTLRLEPLTKKAFAAFGDVIELNDSAWFPINGGTTRRYHDLSAIQVSGQDGRAGISLAVGDAFDYPLRITMLERHPLGSQSWIPRNAAPFIAVVAPNGADQRPDELGLRAFYAQGDQGVTYHQGTWHHPLMTLGRVGEFIVVDRIGEQPNCDESNLSMCYIVDGSFVSASEPAT